MDKKFKEWLENVINKGTELTERMLEYITDNLQSDDIAYVEDQIEYLKEVLENDNN